LTATVDLGRAIQFQFMQPGHTGRFVEATSIGSFVLAACRPIGWLVLAGERRLMELGEAEIRARSMAERAAEANRAKSEFVRMMGHEIRNPLSAILATTDLLLDQRLAPEQRDFLFLLQSTAKSLVKVTDDVLDLSILESGSLTIASSEFDFPAVAADVAKMFEPVARNKGLELTVEYDAGMSRRFLGDSDRIRQVIVNFVSNALKFTSQGRIVIRASCETPAEGKARIRLAVSDTGSGISPEKIVEIFQRTSTFRADGAHGIALVISRKLIERMGGAVEVESHVGKGSTFRFVLPLRLA
jgi:signal transduction histidine kinase